MSSGLAPSPPGFRQGMSPRQKLAFHDVNPHGTYASNMTRVQSCPKRQKLIPRDANPHDLAPFQDTKRDPSRTAIRMVWRDASAGRNAKKGRSATGPYFVRYGAISTQTKTQKFTQGRKSEWYGAISKQVGTPKMTPRRGKSAWYGAIFGHSEAPKMIPPGC